MIVKLINVNGDVFFCMHQLFLSLSLSLSLTCYIKTSAVCENALDRMASLT